MTRLLFFYILFLFSIPGYTQSSFKLKYKNSSVYAGIDIGSKGVKMSILEVGKNSQKTGTFNILQETSVNTDFISFTDPTFHATLTGLCSLYTTAVNTYQIPPSQVYTVISSGVRMQADKDDKNSWLKQLIDSFRICVSEPTR